MTGGQLCEERFALRLARFLRFFAFRATVRPFTSPLENCTVV
jgi:hypothetical protein